MKNQRKYLRVNVITPPGTVTYELKTAEDEKLTKGDVVNISQRGLFIKSDHALKIGLKVNLTLTLRETGQKIKGKASVMWVNTDALGEYLPVGLGLEILDLDQTEAVYVNYIESRLEQLKIADLMSTDIVFVDPNATVSETVGLLKKARVGAVVVKGEDEVTGIFTERDLMMITDSVSFAEEKVKDHMTTEIEVVPADASTKEAYEIFRYCTHRHLPVVEGKDIVGMVSTRDFFPYWTELMDLYSKRLEQEHERAMSLIVHDLRSPIGLIKSANTLMSDSRDDENVANECLEMVDINCDVMLKLIDELLELSRIKIGDIRIQKQDVNLSDVVERIIRYFQAPAQEKEISIELQIDKDIPVIKADSLRIEQILHNLISNAVKFSHRGSHVVVGLTSKGDRVCLSVKDTGQGIPPDDIPKLFKEFSKINSRPTEGESSTGLGLAITRKFVEAHGGTISVESKLGEGSTFSVLLPVS